METGAGGRVATANLDFLALARRSPELKANLRASTMVVADGTPVAWLARLTGSAATRRIAGVDLVEGLCRTKPGLRVAMYGSSPEIASPAALHLRNTLGANVVSQVCPPFRPLTGNELAEHLREISQSEPDLILVALGCPAQERFISASFHQRPQAVWIGVGGTFDFFSGRRARAPRLVQAIGLEWMMRFAQEPRRLGARYFFRDLPALAKIAPGCLARRFRPGRVESAPDSSDPSSGLVPD
jgi:N-acetylglucosaminyldiphosphoundecaprenol N-acetyl-beta-D-mannosaminyltransferase